MAYNLFQSVSEIAINFAGYRESFLDATFIDYRGLGNAYVIYYNPLNLIIFLAVQFSVFFLFVNVSNGGLCWKICVSGFTKACECEYEF